MVQIVMRIIECVLSELAILLHDKQHGLFCSHAQGCIAEPHMMLASLHYKAHEWPCSTVMTGSIMLATGCIVERNALGCRLTNICVV